ncbi:hypothetical protein ACSD7O_17445 [Methylorubrum extorquens]|uniref:hypothetical protein n=1 Tax=Methylorubrum extorquens TaxID=408 RepID=UPI003F6070B8
MKVRDREYVGRSGRGRDASALVTPVAERSDDGAWSALADVRALFPKQGQIEVRGIVANSLREGDWVAFGSVPNDRHGSSASFRASSPRRLTPFLAAGGEVSPEGRRRLVVEAGLEAGSAGDWSVQVSPEAFVRVKLQQGEDGRFRASGPDLASLTLWRLTPDLVLDLGAEHAAPRLCDHQRAEQLPGTVNWSRDDEYIRMAAAALGPERRGPDIAALLAWALSQHTDVLTGRVSTLAGADAGTLTEIERAGTLSRRLASERELLNLFRAGLMSDPSVKELIDQAAADAAEATRPALEGAVRAEIEREMAAERAAAHEQVRALIVGLEAEEIAALEARCTAEAAKRDEELAEARRKGMEAVEAATAERLREAEAAAAGMDARRASLTGEVEELEGRRQGLAASVAALAEEERSKLEIVERLVKAGEDAAALRKPMAAPAVLAPWPSGSGNERRLGLRDLAGLAEEAGLLSPPGMETFLRVAVLVEAGEVPILHGPDTGGFLEVAGRLMATGRVARLYADPTLITFDDLWARAGSGVPTPLAVALASAAEGSTALGVVERAERSGARFWYPQLADAARQGRLPAALIPLVTVAEPKSEEAAAVAAEGPLVAVEGIFADGAAAVAPLVFAELAAAPAAFAKGSCEPDPGEAAKFLRKHAAGLDLPAAIRLSRIHAAASSARGAEGGPRMAAALKTILFGSDETVPQAATQKPYLAARA